MMFALILALMTAAAILALLVPLAASRAGEEPAASDVAVYRDQLAEIERDRERGLLGEAEAEAARVEVSRRLIAAADHAAAAATRRRDGAVRRSRVAAAVALIAVPAIASASYLATGRPDLPDQPLAARAQNEQHDIAALVRRVEAELKQRPDDGRGWEVLAPVYLRTGRFQEAAQAFSHASALLGETPERLAGWGEAVTLAADGMVSPEAKAAFERAVSLEPGHPRAQFWLGQAAVQAGDTAGAARIYRSMIETAPPKAPWLGAARRALAEVALGEEGRLPEVDPATLASADPAQRPALVRSMVESLETRLRSAPSDLGGQLRLIRALATLGEADRSKAALGRARAALAGDGEALRRLGDLAFALGLEG